VLIKKERENEDDVKVSLVLMIEGEGGTNRGTGLLSELLGTIVGFDCMILGGCRSEGALLSYHPRLKERSSR
jgi:hypothetical protein